MAIQRLREAAEKAKIELSSSVQVCIVHNMLPTSKHFFVDMPFFVQCSSLKNSAKTSRKLHLALIVLM